MARKKITYENKVDLKTNTSIANKNKVNAVDMNEIKEAINESANTEIRFVSNNSDGSITVDIPE